MSEFTWSLLVIGTYRILGLLSGVLSIYLGYKLFMKGVYEKAGDLKATWGDKHLVMKQSAPGTFFAVFGSIVIAAGMWRGIHISNHESSAPQGLPSVTQPAKTEQLQGPVGSSPKPEPAERSNDSKSQNLPTAKPVLLDSHAVGVQHSNAIQPIITDVLSGKPLSDDQRKLLQQWLDDQNKWEKFWEQQANQPKPLQETQG